jgi:hypothetical protein
MSKNRRDPFCNSKASECPAKIVRTRLPEVKVAADRFSNLPAISRIVGELKGLVMSVSATTVRTWLRVAGLGPAGPRRSMTWLSPQRQTQPGELLWEFGRNHSTWSCEFRDAFAVEAQILRDLEVVMRRVRVRVSPVRWAEDKREASERGEGLAGTFSL